MRHKEGTLSGDTKITECVTIERSEFYDGFTKNLYIVVGGIYDVSDAETINRALAKFKSTVPDAYAKKTKIYMGCLH